jgi:NAD(P)-dependent dehydrogenase (short-subunit alcohol dehydrogenase family)
VTLTSLDLDGRGALVTGAGRGIGRATALGLAAAGAHVALLARSVGELKETARLLRAAGGVAIAVPTDLGDTDQIGTAVERVRAEIGVVDVLVNNAAVVWPLGPSTDIDPAQWTTAIAVNVTAVAQLSFLLLPAMIERGWGRIVNVSSAIAAHPATMIGANAYATSKAALEAHTINLAAELAGTSVTVNAFRPGGVDTAMQAWIRDQEPAQIGTELHTRFVSSYENGALITAETSAQSLLAHLASPDSGQIWDVSDPAQPPAPQPNA